jgi:ureidoacrylate peracid hydrolase
MHKIDIPDPSTLKFPPMNHFETLDMAKTALLVVDLQNVFVEEGQPAAGPYAAEIVPNVNRIAEAVRQAGGTVVFTRHTVTDVAPFALAPWQIAEGTPIHAMKAFFEAGCYSHAIYGGLDVKPEDIIVDKYRYSAFIHNSSTLHEQLASLGIDTLIVTGTVTNCCCESSARDANMMGYKVVFATDANCALTDADHNAALLSMQMIFADVRSTEEILSLVNASKPVPAAVEV